MHWRDIRSGLMWGTAAGVAAYLIGTAVAQIVPALPFQLQNNTVADATQVMANFNQLLNNVNANAAKNGANSDITSLLGLTTPLAPSVGGTTTYTGGTSTGSANAQVVASVVPSTFTLAVGTRVVFVAGFSNTDAMTLDVAGTGAKNVFRQTQFGPFATVGGEVTTIAGIGQTVEVVYDGTQYQLPGPPVIVGEIKDYTGTSPPTGWGFADGQCMSQTGQGALLFGILSVNWGSCAVGQFARPDLRGRVGVGRDDMTAAANRVTFAGSGCTGTTLALGCGLQNHTLLQSQLPSVTWPSTLALTDPGHLHTQNHTMVAFAAGGGSIMSVTVPGGNAWSTGTNTTGVTLGGSVTSGGSGFAFQQLQPSIIVNKIVKY